MKLCQLIALLGLDDPEAEVRFNIQFSEPGGRNVHHASIDPPDALREVPNPYQYITKPEPEG